MDIAVSVIVPVYNAEPYLKQCLDSVLAQTLENIEIIIIDDGSTDGSAEICKSYLTDGRVSYHRKENEGLAAARRDGMARASGEYIGFVDSDDWLEPNMYERMYGQAKEYGADVVFCNVIEDEDGYNQPKYLETGFYDRQRILAEVLPRTLASIKSNGSNGVIRWCNWLRIYRKAMLDEHGFKFDGRFRRSQDLQLTYEAMLWADAFVYLGDDYLYHNRQTAGSLSRGYTKNMWPLYIPLIDRLYEDTRSFTELDLSKEMDLCAFFFAASTVRNECELSTGMTAREKISKLDEIVNDERVRNAFKSVEADRLSDYYKMVYSGLASGSAKKLYRLYKGFERKKRLKLRRRRFVSSIMKNRVTGAIYKKIRGIE